MNARLLSIAAATAGLVMILAAAPAAQSAADYQALRKELDLMREKIAQMQKEIDSLKAQRTSPAAAATQPIMPVSNVTLNLARAPFRGSTTSKVTMVEISDFECPFCGRYSRETGPEVLKQYADTNRIGYAFVNYPLPAHPFAPKAGEAAACAADQGKFWEMHDILFRKQGAALAPAFLPQKGDLIPGLNKTAYNACLESSKHAAYIKSDMTMVQPYAPRGTPAFFIGTMDPATRMFKGAVSIVGAKPLSVFQQALDEQLARAGITR
jgi:protein-disulfide isomerase